MAKRRANGEGHIYKDKKTGGWGGMLTIGYFPNGRQKFKYFSGKTQQEVRIKMDEYKALLNKGVCIEPNKLTVGDWLDQYYESHIINKVKTSTRASDESVIRRHLKPHLGKIKLTELKGPRIQQMYNEMLNTGRIDGKGGLNPKTIKNIHLVLHKALEQAVKEDILIKNPLKCVTLPRIIDKEIEILAPEEQKNLEKECFDHPWGIAILLTLYSGMRRGELLALSWDDINFDKSIIRINKQLNRIRDFSKDAKARTKLCLREETKTAKSTRFIAISPVIMQKLKEHKQKQDLERTYIGKAYNNLNMVFCRTDGNYIDPKTFSDFYLKTLEKAGISHKTFHALRHTFATRALETNANIKVVSEILGHASIQITLDTYFHPSLELQQETMQRLTDMFYED